MSPSALATMRLRMATPSGALRSRVMSRLLRLMTRNAADSPSLCGGHVRDSSPLAVSSILMTSAPRSDRSMPQNGPASTRERSSTRMPSGETDGGVMVMRYYTSHVLAANGPHRAHPRARRGHGHDAPGRQPHRGRLRRRGAG